MNVILFDDPAIRVNLFPFTLTRPVGAIRIGILTIAEKWEQWLKTTVSFQTEDYLSAKFPRRAGVDDLLINGALCPDAELKAAVSALPSGYFLVQGNLLLAARNPRGAMTE